PVARLPLVYAERDAQSLIQSLINDAGFLPDYCVRLTDNSPPAAWGATTPDRTGIQTAIAQVCQRLKPSDCLWLFFSGYGMHYQGKDYLMPQDSDPTQPAQTGLSVEFLYSLLQAAPTKNLLVLLDINRSQGVLSGVSAGAHTAALAEQYGIPTVLSCRQNQLSHETIALRHGLFTAAVLEGLKRPGCVTLEHLVQFLQTRLPELSDHHWRPRQEPLAIIPDNLRYQLIVPGKETLSPALPSFAPVEAPDQLQPAPHQDEPPRRAGSEWPSPQTPELHPDWRTPSLQAPSQTPATRPERPLERSSPPPPLVPVGSESESQRQQESTPLPSESLPAPPPPPHHTPAAIAADVADVAEDRSWWQLVRWGSGLLSLLIVAVIVRNLDMVMRSPANGGQTVAVQPSPAVAVPPTGNSLPNPAANSITAQPPAPLPSPATAANPAANSLNVPPQSPAPFAPDTRPVSEAALPMSDRDIMNAAMANLTKVRAESSSNQVSEISEAIRLLRQIRPDQPLYKDAQQAIDRWSQVILDMALGRAMQRNGGDLWLAANNYRAAIAAAQLVPSDRPDTYQAAQQAIAGWSQQILNLANVHAQSGALSQAVQVAQLVPPGTAAYDAAQGAIAAWQNQLASGIGAAPPDQPLTF
ncbi:MAG: caspase family protein, partial [Cyanobacteriota bacterium]